MLPSFQILDFDDSIYDENEECIGVKRHVIQEEEECQPIYENSPKEKTISSRFKTSTPVESLNDVYKTCLDPRLLHASSPVHTCPIFMYGDYSPPAADQYCRFSSVPRAWFSTHQPMGDRDAVTLHHLVFRPNGRDYFSPTFGKHCNNAPYFLDYIRLFPAASVEFDRTKLEFFKLLPLNADVQEGDRRVMVTSTRTVSYRKDHPIFIPMCLTWINVGPLEDPAYDIHVLGSTHSVQQGDDDDDSDIIDSSD